MTVQSKMTTAVPIKLSWRAEESLSSYLSRVAEANAYEHLRWLVKHGGARLDPTRWSSVSVRSLCELVGLTVAEFHARIYNIENTGKGQAIQRRFLHSRVKPRMISFGMQRYCPECLRECGHNLVFFDLQIVGACPYHGEAVRDRCHECQALSHWGRPGVTHCHACSADFRRAPSTKAAPGLLGLSRAVAFKARSPTQGTLGKTRLWPAEADHLDLGQFIELLTLLGALAGESADKSRSERVYPVAGYEALCEWPQGYFKLLEKVAPSARTSATGTVGGWASYGFGHFYNRLSSAIGPEDEPWLMLKRYFARYFVSERQGKAFGRKDSAIFEAEDLAARRLITKREVQGMFGLGYIATNAIISAKRMRVVENDDWRGRHCFVDRHDVLEVIRAGPPVRYQEACKILGADHRQIRELVASGLLTPLVGSLDGSPNAIVFTRHDIMQLLEALKERVKHHPTRHPNAFVWLAERKAKILNVSLQSLYAGLLSGRLPIRGYGEGDEGFNAILLNKAEVDRFIHEIHDEQCGDIEGLTHLRVANLIGASALSVRLLKRKGFFEGREGRHPRISRASYRDFTEIYISRAQIERIFLIPRRFVTLALSTAGIATATNPNLKCGIVLYRRDDVIRLFTPGFVTSLRDRAQRIASRSRPTRQLRRGAKINFEEFIGVPSRTH